MNVTITVGKAEIISHLANNPSISAFKFQRPDGFILTYKIASMSFESDNLNAQDISDLETAFGSRIVDLAVVGYQTPQLDLSELASLLKADIVGGAPEALDTLNELAAAINDDENFASTITNQIASIQSTVDAIPSAEAAIVSYLDRHFFQKDTISIHTNSNSFLNVVDETFNLSHSAKYKVHVEYTYSYDATNNDFESELLVNGAKVRGHLVEPKEAGGNVDGAGTDQSIAASFSYIADFNAGNSDFVFRIRPQLNGVEASVRDVTLTVERFL